MNQKLQAIAGQAGESLRALVKDADIEIMQAWDACLDEATLQESKPRLRLGFSITLDLEKDLAEYDLSFGIRRKFSCVSPMPDPTQLELTIENPLATIKDDTVTIKTPGGGAFTAPLGKMREAVERVRSGRGAISASQAAQP